MKKLLIFTALIILILGAVYYYFFSVLLSEKPAINSPVKVMIPKGASIVKSISIVNEQNLLMPDYFFKFYARLYAKLNNASIFAGYYRFQPGISNLEIIQSLFNADNLYVSRVTIPEGWEFKKIASLASKTLNTNINEMIKLSKSDSLLKSRNIKSRSIEGYLMPNTYDFFKDISASEIINYLLDEHEKMWEKEIAPLIPSNFSLTKHQILTLASIVEAESATPDERPIIAGLYYNRLKLGMPLQADPTVAYAIGENRRLLYSDLSISSPYNTYKVKGLPPGPINNPGVESIKAVIKPATHNYIFMVAVGDGSGKHNFSTTKAQHDNYVKQYRKNRGF